MLEEDRTAICGPRYQHQADRPASRAGTVPSEVVLGGRKVAIRRPRVRADGEEVPLPTFQAMASDDPLNRRVVEQMLVGVATRQYARSLEPLPATCTTRGTSKSAVSRRFVAKTAAQLDAWQSRRSTASTSSGCCSTASTSASTASIVALGIDRDGQKHALGLWEGSTENATVCQSLLANLQSRGLRTDRSLWSSSMARRRCTKPCARRLATPPWSNAARCTSSATFSIICRSGSGRGSRRSCSAPIAAPTSRPPTRLLQDLARRLETEYPSAAESVREGLDETLTVLALGSRRALRQSLRTTNATESLISRTRHVKRNVKRWRGGQMVLRWTAAGVLEAVKGFRRLKGHKEMPQLVAALRARDQQLGIVVADVENVA